MPDHPDELLSAENLSFKCSVSFMLKNISLVLKKGESLALTGGSGSGKTTLARILAGMILPDEGVLSVSPELKRVIVNQQDQFMSLSGKRSTYYGQRYENQGMESTPGVREYLFKIRAGTSSSEDETAVEAIMERMHLSVLAETRLLQLSNGERKRTQLAAALLENPDLLILDQPFTGLDTAARENLAGLLEKQMEAGLTLVIVCDAAHIPEYMHQVLELDKGRISRFTRRERYVPAERADRIEPGIHDERLSQLLTPVKEQFVSMIRMNQVNVTIGGKEILKNINWHVKSGERWALLGPNGAGKTTLLSLVTADNPQGYVNDLLLFDRKRGSGESIWDIKKRIGFISPELHLYFMRGEGISNTIPGLRHKPPRYDSLTCGEVILSGFRDEIGFTSPPTDLQQERTANWLSVLKLDHLKDRPYNQVSLGQQRSLLLVRALIKSPSLLILDEPCQGLDHAQTSYFLQLLNLICTHLNTTLIYVTHLREEIPACVNKMIMLSEGQVTYCGDYR